ncbi:MAG: Radical domain protein [Acidobacteria bacterium]|nr:Radical domain protein [Acidobacteriota bacterium]
MLTQPRETADAVDTTFGGAPINNLTKGLPKIVESLCPEPGCGRVIDARLFAEDGKVYMEKTCPEHGYVKDLYWSDVELYLRAEKWEFGDFRGLSNPYTVGEQCPRDCGPCQKHTSHTALGNIDLTNRCNLTCPICFANANVTGTVYEPTREQIKEMLGLYRKEQPVRGRVVQFSGGEPTIHPEFLDILRDARELGYVHQQIASNGIKLADPDFAARAADAGLHTIYLQFDGLDDRVYEQLRGRPLLDVKMKAVESIRRAGMKIVYVPTIAKTINDDQVVPILKFAIENIDVSSGISYQPVALTGRVSHEERRRLRYTIPDLAHAITDAGFTDLGDWYPLSLVSPISKFISAMREEPTVHITCHPHCSLGTYLAVEPDTKRPVALPSFIDVEGMFSAMDERADKMARSRFKVFQQAGAFADLHRYFRPEGAPAGMDFKTFLRALQGLLDKKVGRDGTEPTYKMLLVAGMHFMDGYNYELERVRRCVIHYATPAGRVIPFCAYNSGLYLREPIEQQFSVPLAEYQQRRRAQQA